MLELSDAQRIAYRFLKDRWKDADAENLVIIEDSTRTEAFGWVFFWSDKRYMETGDVRYALQGNLPIVVLRDSGQVLHLPHRTWEKDVAASIRTFAASLRRDHDA
jgi:hypothetical protein